MKKNKIIKQNLSNDYNVKKLKIKALDTKDIKILSTLCQDGIFTFEEMKYFNYEKVFIATFSRFCWENYDNINQSYRVVSGIQIKEINYIEFVNFNDEEKTNFLNLLAITFKNKCLELNFSSSKLIKINVNKINILLEDINLPWPTKNRPMHK